jgi:hypothetical protein
MTMKPRGGSQQDGEAHIFARSERARGEPSAKKDFETEYSAASLLQVRASLSS